jgi:UDP-glucuronate 4-epimerase
VTGAAGFIGSFVSHLLLDQGAEVVGVDNLNDYYPPELKRDRLRLLHSRPGFVFKQLEIASEPSVKALFTEFSFSSVVHLAAQGGVRYSIENPKAYIDSNLVGFSNILEGCRQIDCGHLVFASSSSVYGSNMKMPFSTRDNVDHPVSLYAATKKANELMAHSYSHLYKLPTTGLRFFTVYGPWGRPDMAYFTFAKKILAGEPIEIFNNGQMSRDFTYVEDIANGVVKVLKRPPTGEEEAMEGDPSRSKAPYRIYNIGNHQPVKLMDMIGSLEKHLGHEARKIFMPMQPGDMLATFADVEDLEKEIGFRPSTSLDEGMSKFAGWYQDYYRPLLNASNQ